MTRGTRAPSGPLSFEERRCRLEELATGREVTLGVMFMGAEDDMGLERLWLLMVETEGLVFGGMVRWVALAPGPIWT